MGSKMKKIIYCLFILVLGACGGNSSGNGTASSSPEINMPDEPTFIPDDTDTPNIEEELTAAEILFGKGNGLGSAPTYLKAQNDNAGFSYMSFGAWGNVYDIVEKTERRGFTFPINFGYTSHEFVDGPYMDFTTQKNTELTTYTYSKDATVENSVFRGPALMYKMPHNPNTGQLLDSDYGTMELKFGKDIDLATVSFVMSNSANNISISSANDEFSQNFSEDRQHVDVQYGLYDNNNRTVTVYHGYGDKQ